MEVTCQMKELLEQIDIHDSEFSGYSYDYENRQIIMRCKNIYASKCLEFIFENVVVSHLQSCVFWGSGYNILWMTVSENHKYLDELNQRQAKNSDNDYGSYLDKGNRYLAIEFTINSGDTLLIICEKVIYKEEIIETISRFKENS